MGLTAEYMLGFMHDRLRIASTNAAAKAKMLRFLNLSGADLWAREKWWFAVEQVTLALANGTASYNLPYETSDVEYLHNRLGKPLIYVAPQVFHSLYKHDSATGHPLVYTLDHIADAGSPADQVLVLTVAPIPASSAQYGNTVMGRIRRYAPLVADADESRIPEEHGMVQVWGALEAMALDDKNAQAQYYGAQKERLYAAMDAEQKRRKLGVKP